MVLFILRYKVDLTFESVDEILKCDIQMKATEQYFPVVLFIMLYKMVLTYESVDEIIICSHLVVHFMPFLENVPFKLPSLIKVGWLVEP